MCPIFEDFNGYFILTNGAHKIAKLCSRHRSISMGVKLSARGENVSLERGVNSVNVPMSEYERGI